MHRSKLRMFKVCITESSYKGIINAEEQRPTAGRSNLYKLLKQQPVQILTVHQMLIPMTLFTESSLNGKSTPPLDAINQLLATLRKFSKSFTYLPESAHRTYLYAVNGKKMEKCLSIRNRLIK